MLLLLQLMLPLEGQYTYSNASAPTAVTILGQSSTFKSKQFRQKFKRFESKIICKLIKCSNVDTKQIIEHLFLYDTLQVSFPPGALTSANHASASESIHIQQHRCQSWNKSANPTPNNSDDHSRDLNPLIVMYSAIVLNWIEELKWGTELNWRIRELTIWRIQFAWIELKLESKKWSL